MALFPSKVIAVVDILMSWLCRTLRLASVLRAIELFGWCIREWSSFWGKELKCGVICCHIFTSWKRGTCLGCQRLTYSARPAEAMAERRCPYNLEHQCRYWYVCQKFWPILFLFFVLMTANRTLCSEHPLTGSSLERVQCAVSGWLTSAFAFAQIWRSLIVQTSKPTLARLLSKLDMRFSDHVWRNFSVSVSLINRR